MKLKICFIGLDSYSLFNPACKRAFGGAEMQLVLLAKTLAKLPDMEVHFVVEDCGQKPTEHIDGVLVHKRWHSFGFPFLRLMKRIGADIYICRSAGAYAGKWALFAKILRKKFIYMAAHDIDCDGTFEKRASFSEALFYRLGLRLADGIVAQNTDQKNHLNRRGLKKITIIKKGLEPPAPNSHVKKRTDVLWVGRCEPWKKPELFIDLAHRFPHERFVMICQPARNQDSFFKTISSKARDAANLRFFEGLAHDRVESFFQKAKIFVLTSLHEGDLPMVALEALKYEVPVLSLSVNPDDCFTRYGFGLYANGNKRTLEDDLKRLLNNPHLYKQCQKAGRDYFNDFCDLARVSRQLLECFKQLITNE